MSAAATLTCLQETRRDAVRHADLNGLDYVDVSEDQRTLTVWFLGRAPADIGVANVRVEGGRRVRDIQVTDVQVQRALRRDRDDWMIVTVDRRGDHSTYTLRVVNVDDEGRPTGALDGFDRRYASLEFAFKQGCPSDLDCAVSDSCVPALREPPEINYLAKDYAGFRQLLLDRLAVLLPEWRDRHVPDVGIALVELLAYGGDYLSQFQDAVATEAYLDTARQRISVRRHARLVDYAMHEGCNARAWIVIESDADFDLDLNDVSFVTRYAGAPTTVSIDRSAVDQLSRGSVEEFEAIWPGRATPFKVQSALSAISFYTWGDAECCLAVGSTEATLLDEWLTPAPNGAGAGVAAVDPHYAHPVHRARALDSLEAGDILIFEEVIGPQTGVPADANVAQRHAVRLTEARRDVDARLTRGPIRQDDGIPVVHIRWRKEDALPFALCLSARKPAPDCGPLTDVSVARGNVILIDHGHTETQDLPPVPGKEPRPICDPCEETEAPPLPARFEPVLDRAPVTFSESIDRTAPASRLLLQDPRRAAPIVELSHVRHDAAPDAPRESWLPERDLLSTPRGERRFVVEIDNESRAHIRFSRDVASRPARDTTLTARYRVGNGPAGNVGAETISLLVTGRHSISGSNVRVRNPLPASGGTAPETVDEVKLFAPRAFRKERQRAVIAADYAELVERDFAQEVQGAAAALRWNGSWYEAVVGVDAEGRVDTPPPLKRRIHERLQRYRRIGHDLEVASARTVPIKLSLHVCVAAHHLSAHVKKALLDLFSSRRLTHGALGFFHPDNLRYGEGVQVSEILAAAHRVPGVASLAVTQLERLGEGPNDEIQNGVLTLGPLEIARLDNDASFPDNGTVTITVEGGR